MNDWYCILKTHSLTCSRIQSHSPLSLIQYTLYQLQDEPLLSDFWLRHFYFFIPVFVHYNKSAWICKSAPCALTLIHLRLLLSSLFPSWQMSIQSLTPCLPYPTWPAALWIGCICWWAESWRNSMRFQQAMFWVIQRFHSVPRSSLKVSNVLCAIFQSLRYFTQAIRTKRLYVL